MSSEFSTRRWVILVARTRWKFEWTLWHKFACRQVSSPRLYRLRSLALNFLRLVITYEPNLALHQLNLTSSRTLNFYKNPNNLILQNWNPDSVGLKKYFSKLMGSDFRISAFDASGATNWRRRRHTRPRQQHNGHIRKFSWSIFATFYVFLKFNAS